MRVFGITGWVVLDFGFFVVVVVDVVVVVEPNFGGKVDEMT